MLLLLANAMYVLSNASSGRLDFAKQCPPVCITEDHPVQGMTQWHCCIQLSTAECPLKLSIWRYCDSRDLVDRSTSSRRLATFTIQHSDAIFHPYFRSNRIMFPNARLQCIFHSSMLILNLLGILVVLI